MIENLIWDFDGSLFNTYPAMVKLFKKALLRKGYVTSENEILSLMKDTLGKAVDFYLDRGVDYDFYKDFKTSEEKLDPAEQPPFEGAREVCSIVVRNGGKNLIITHRSRKTAFKLLSYFEMTSLFSDIITRESGFKRKPDPDAFIYAIRNFRLDPRSTLSIGDRDLDVIAARDAGTKTCFFSQNGTRPSIDVDFIICDLVQLEEIVLKDSHSR
ncbi:MULTISPECIES: HAD-IA family hydrolase [unclassified Mesotoga]|jgi:HAD superfamily hydrolase (TIGR01549 family)|uniref:HAD-IA family hydrolase n=1 Tax=unclassified Mesotoga TaxID=1184398 RepID=UPI000EF1FFF8|nr:MULTISPECIES: HAD-IA family hydrolase [unclassified Mesotoga]NLT44437.1 HAD-IA family hydrolase [Thermotogaceae bacterium]MDD3681364.1 HAD-IA family hydrolase [Mesotoga sp.]MDD4826461.1 HAD-IA family hydrolase [Mesotoga sp.]MDD5683409.1 HAD-IA family hydrolase [Mesotoga sp.]RLL83736.1 phosphatase [Mesotoga sp. BH458_6_3_2_1]